MIIKRKRLIFVVLLILINLLVFEIISSVVYFHRNSRYPLALVHYWYIAERVLSKYLLTERDLLKTKPVHLYEYDPKYGYSHVANSRGTYKSRDFKGTYTIGNDKGRVIPVPEEPLGRILFLGGSLTYGYGVDDDKTYPYILSQKYWRNWHIVNKAVSGWGTSHAYMTLSEEMERDKRPSVVIYGMISQHIQRNYIREGWVHTVAKYFHSHPHFELVDGNLEFQGVVNVSESKPYSSEVRKKELELTRAFLIEMKKK